MFPLPYDVGEGRGGVALGHEGNSAERYTAGVFYALPRSPQAHCRRRRFKEIPGAEPSTKL